MNRDFHLIVDLQADVALAFAWRHVVPGHWACLEAGICRGRQSGYEGERQQRQPVTRKVSGSHYLKHTVMVLTAATPNAEHAEPRVPPIGPGKRHGARFSGHAPPRVKWRG